MPRTEETKLLVKSFGETEPKALFWTSTCVPGFEYAPQGGGGVTPHMKGVGMLIGNFELNPLIGPYLIEWIGYETCQIPQEKITDCYFWIF